MLFSLPASGPSASFGGTQVTAGATTGADGTAMSPAFVANGQQGSFKAVVTAEGEALLRTPLRELLPRLDAAHFKQIHRSTIVNLKAVAGILRDDSGRGTVRLKQRPETLTVSQPFMALFKHM